MLLPIEIAIRDLVGAAVGVTDMNYFGATLAQRQEDKGLVELATVSRQNRRTKAVFRVALAFGAETPDALKERVYGAATSLQTAFQSDNPRGTCLGAIGGVSGITAAMGEVTLNGIEGYAEQSTSSRVRWVKTSMAFEVTVEAP